ncbi:adhesion G-protein coupled receptor G2-like isoform X2 [Sycon ciliatum]
MSLNSTYDRALIATTYASCGLSMSGLLVTLVTIAIQRKLRESTHQKLMFGLSLTLLISLLLFLPAGDLGVVQPHHTPDNPPLGCSVLALFLHYLLLCSFLWSCADATQLCQNISNSLLGKKADFNFSGTFWLVLGTPLLIVTITAIATDMMAYGKPEGGIYCWIKDWRMFYAAFVLPVSACILYNMAMLIPVMRFLHQQSRKRLTPAMEAERGQQMALFRVALSLAMFHAMVWAFGLLAVLIDQTTMHFTLMLLTALQALTICVNTLCSQGVMADWMELVMASHSTNSATTVSSSTTTVNSSSTAVNSTASDHSSSCMPPILARLLSRTLSASSATTQSVSLSGSLQQVQVQKSQSCPGGAKRGSRSTSPLPYPGSSLHNMVQWLPPVTPQALEFENSSTAPDSKMAGQRTAAVETKVTTEKSPDTAV